MSEGVSFPSYRLRLLAIAKDLFGQVMLSKSGAHVGEGL